MLALARDLLQVERPSFHTGFARNASESAYPTLWNGLAGMWCPSIGIQGRRLEDFSGRGHHGSFSTGMGSDAWIPSPWGWALKYDGTDDCINLGVSPIDMNSDFTVMARARIDTIAENSRVLFGASASGSAASGYFMLIHRADKSGLILQYDTGPGGAAFCTSPSKNMVIDTWYTFVYRRSNSQTTIFQDDYVTVLDSTTMTYTPSNTQNWGIGTWDPINVTNNWKGYIGDVILWDRALTGREMELLAQGNAHPMVLADKMLASIPIVSSGSVATVGGMMLMGVGR